MDLENLSLPPAKGVSKLLPRRLRQRLEAHESDSQHRSANSTDTALRTIDGSDSDEQDTQGDSDLDL